MREKQIVSATFENQVYKKTIDLNSKNANNMISNEITQKYIYQIYLHSFCFNPDILINLCQNVDLLKKSKLRIYFWEDLNITL